MSGKLLFDHHFNGVSFPVQLLKQPNKEFDPVLLAILEAQVQVPATASWNQETLLDQISVVIYAEIGNGPVSSEKVAAQAGLSRSSLHRRLREQGMTFRELRDRIIFGIARDQLSTSAITITELALNLGYSETSSFDRAFKRVAGNTPLEYRKQHSPC